jgi:hypothetical protein
LALICRKMRPDSLIEHFQLRFLKHGFLFAGNETCSMEGIKEGKGVMITRAREGFGR